MLSIRDAFQNGDEVPDDDEGEELHRSLESGLHNLAQVKNMKHGKHDCEMQGVESPRDDVFPLSVPNIHCDFPRDGRNSCLERATRRS